MSDRDRSGQITATAVLAVVANVLEDLPRRVAAIEAHAAALAASAPETAGLRVALQDLDLIRQTLEDLGRLAHAAGGGETHDAATLAGCLRLGALRARLTVGPRGDGSLRAAESDMGLVDLFGPLDGPANGP